MGTYINPGNAGFTRILEDVYVDKTGLVSQFDSVLESPRSLVMVSRPRRFGKSYAAQSIAAFYDRTCDSRFLFEGRAVSTASGMRHWDRHLNSYNVVLLDMTEIVQASGADDVVNTISELLVGELREISPEAGKGYPGNPNSSGALRAAFLDVVRSTGRKFVFVVDEWDAPYRLAHVSANAQNAYADWLRGLFKNAGFTPKAVAGAYLTGILPIKKYAHQSAVSDFWEYTMVRPDVYAPFVGFTESEVEELCAECGLDMADVCRWYDGYSFPEERHVFAPYSVMRACAAKKTGAYWVSTEAYESLRPYIEMDFDGLQEDIVKAIGATSVDVDPDGFQNDMTTILGKDDVLTLLVHLGYLSYDEETRMARVPNEEVRSELARAVKRSRHPILVKLMRESEQLLSDIVNLQEDAVAAGIGRVHDREAAPLFYNNEQALRSVVKTALVASVDEYSRVEELPGGKGFADVVYLPRRGSALPALVVELKWNEPVCAAIEQIRMKGYPDVLRDLDVPVLLVGIAYDKATKEHRCSIEALGVE